MIKRFSVLYVGQIDLDDVGANGRAPDDRRYTNEQLIQAYCPGKCTEASILGWLKRLIDKKRLGFELNETALDVFTLLFRGDDEEEISKKLSETYDVTDFETFQQDIRNFCGQLRSHELLKGLIPKETSSDLPIQPGFPR